MSLNTIAEYRNLYTNRHGIQCPLSDTQVRAAMASAGAAEDEWPLVLAVITEMETLVASDFPEVDQSQWKHGGIHPMQDLVLDNATSSGFDANFSLPGGGNTPYSIQLQIAPDADGVPGEWANHGAAQADNTEIVATGLTAETDYWARIRVTDNNGEVAYSNEETIATTAE